MDTRSGTSVIYPFPRYCAASPHCCAACPPSLLLGGSARLTVFADRADFLLPHTVRVAAASSLTVPAT
jgi:hypothetical protein